MTGIAASSIHTTVGVYRNGEHKVNGVPKANLDDHIEYNLTFRPGRAFFVDGKCVHNGYLSDSQCKKWEKKLAGIKRKTDTQPYH